MKSKLLGVLLVCFAATLWGLDGVVLTPRLMPLGVPFAILLIHLIPFIGMQPFLWKSYRKLFSMKREGWISLILVALFGGLIGSLAMVKALFMVNFTNLSMVILLQKLQPIFAILLAALILKERITKQFIGYTLIALIGAYLLTFGLAMPVGASLTAGVYALIAAASFGSATVFGKKLLNTLSFTDATYGRFGLTTIFAFIWLLILGSGFPFSQLFVENNWIMPTWAILLTIAATTGGGAIFLYYYGLTRIKATTSTICELCLPLSAVIFDWLFNKHLLDLWQWVGVLLLLGAIWRITSFRTKSHQ